MPFFQLDEEIWFPPVDYADESGLLAIGGDLSSERILHAYSQGIFPWFEEGEPICWWAPDPRSVLIPKEVSISKSMRPYLNRRSLEVRINTAFEAVIAACQKIYRPGQLGGTWITAEMQTAYVALHKLGFAHSIETWEDEELIGGLYGISLGRVFFGESMFSLKSNASKLALIRLAQKLHEAGFPLIDCQIHNSHLESMGAREIPRLEFQEILKKAIKQDAPESDFWSGSIK
jgi:leucyl/phenylalanyl-tRNA--protein transferase